MSSTPDFGAALFRPEAVDSETLALNEKLRRASLDGPARTEIPLSVERTMAPGGGLLPPVARRPNAETRNISGPAAPLNPITGK